jgi:hypothetical protein
LLGASLKINSETFGSAQQAVGYQNTMGSVLLILPINKA